ncbi:hypothetical protein GCM10027181_15070 [Rheinheimera gaetbuli]
MFGCSKITLENCDYQQHYLVLDQITRPYNYWSPFNVVLTQITRLVTAYSMDSNPQVALRSPREFQN